MSVDEIIDPALIRHIAQEILAQRRIPSATYRLQFHSGFTFRDARALVPYLKALGISDCYASPLQKPRANSTHGYDICDHSRINPALGGEEEFDAFAAALREHGMGLILDTVPNHMGIGDPMNTWWGDVLENGPSSSYARYFDIDWHPVKPELEYKVLLPILGDQYGAVLEGGQIRLGYHEGAFHLAIYDYRLPIAPGTYSQILSLKLGELTEALGEDDEHLQEYQSILTALSYLPSRTEQDPERLAERNREKEVIKRRLAALYAASAEVRGCVDEAIASYNGRVGDPASFDLLDALIDHQAYRLAFWRVAVEEINYRRFFDINDLAAIRVELPEVFHATHQLIFRLLAEGKVTGLRIDHPDGLWDPPAYFRKLQEHYLLDQVRARLGDDALGAQGEIQGDGHAYDVEGEVAGWVLSRYTRVTRRALLRRNQTLATSSIWPLYVVAEKILSEEEPLPSDWAVSGTVGYDFLSQVNGIFVDRSRRQRFDRIYADFLSFAAQMRRRNDSPPGKIYAELVNGKKKMIMLIALASEINALSHLLERISERNRHYRDFTLNSLTFAIREIIACLPIYRTYVDAPSGTVSPRDREFIEATVAQAKRRNPRTSESIFDFIRDTLLLQNVESFREEDRPALHEFVMKFQQLTGPIMAKGVEDTVFYVYNRLISLNEVGGHPERFGISPATFHQQNQERLRRWPHAMLSTSTHDTKRSEDVRARINVLSELPDEWEAALRRWSELNSRHKRLVDGAPAPDRNDEYLLYQALLGIWPCDQPQAEELAAIRERIAGYMNKATREAKVHTSWVNPNADYDAAVQHFIGALLDEETSGAFLSSLQPLARRVGFYGQLNALSQALLKLTAPGVPDIYQGCELWDLSLVDPDNRRPVDYELRARLLEELTRRVDQAARSEQAAGDGGLVELARELLATIDDGRIKLYLTMRALHHRLANQQLFAGGDYRPLNAVGPREKHICAFERALDGRSTLVVVPRLVAQLCAGREQLPIGHEAWGDSWLELPSEREGQRYRSVLTGAVLETDQRGRAALPLGAIFADLPVALLEKI